MLTVFVSSGAWATPCSSHYGEGQNQTIVLDYGEDGNGKANWNDNVDSNNFKFIVVQGKTDYNNLQSDVFNQIGGKENNMTLNLSDANLTDAADWNSKSFKIGKLIMPKGYELSTNENIYSQNNGWNQGKNLRYACALSADGKTINIVGGSFDPRNSENAIKSAIEANEYPFNVEGVTKINIVADFGASYITSEDKAAIQAFNAASATTTFDETTGKLSLAANDLSTPVETIISSLANLNSKDEINTVEFPDGSIFNVSTGKLTSTSSDVSAYTTWLNDNFTLNSVEQTLGNYVSIITEGSNPPVTQIRNAVNAANFDLWPDMTSAEKEAIEDATNVKLLGTFYADALSAINSKNSGAITTLDLSDAGWPEGQKLSSLCDTETLEVLTLPSSLTAVPAEFASGFSALTTLSMPNGVETIGNKAFYGCTSLATINWPTSLTAIGTEDTTDDIGPFQGCTALTSLDLSSCENLTLIGKDAFNSSGITSATLPTSLETIYGEAFHSSALQSINLGGLNNLTTIGFEAFEECASLTSVTFPQGKTQGEDYIAPKLENIGNDAFKKSGVTSINLEKCYGIKEFGHNGGDYETFAGCTALQTVVLPPNLKSLPDDTGEGVFYGCSNLETVVFTGTADYDTNTCGKYEEGKTNQLKADNQLTIGNQAFKDLSKLKNVTLSNNIISIGTKAFQATAIEEIHIPASVETVGVNAFMDCHKLAVVVFDEIDSKCAPCLHAKTTIVGENDGDGAFRQCDHITDVYVNTTVDIECENKAFDYQSTFGHTDAKAPLATLHYPEGHEAHYVNLNHYITEEVAGDAGLFQAWLQKHFEAASDPLATQGGYEPNGWYEFVNSGPSRDPDDPEYEIYDNGDVILRTFSDFHYARIVPKGIKAYIIKRIDKVEKAISQDNPDEKIKYFQLTLQSIPVIPAQTGVILYGEPNANQVDQNGVTKRTLAMSAVQYKPGEGQPLRRDYWNELATELTKKQVEAKITEPDNIRLKNFLMPLDTEDGSAIHLKPYERDPQTGAVAFRTFIMSRFGETIHLQHTDGLHYAANNDNYMGFFRVVEGNYSGGYAYLRLTSEEFNEAEGAECRVKMDEKYQYEYDESGNDYDATQADPWKYWRYADWTERTKNWGARPARFDNFSIGAVRFLGELEDADGIIKVTIPAEVTSNDDYYTLQGVKVTNPSKGVYIRNGKKVVVK